MENQEIVNQYPKQVQVVYAGLRSRDDNFTDLFYLVENGIIGNRLSFGKLKKNKFVIGCIYEISQTDKETFIVNAKEFKGQLKDESQIIEFRVLNTAAEESLYQKNRIQKIKQDNPMLEEIVKPLKEVYSELSRKERQALLSYLIEMITYNVK